MTTKQVADNIARCRESIAQTCSGCNRKTEEIRMMAVTKTVDVELINFAIDSGIDLIGENRVQEFCEKYDSYHKKQLDIHFIGHLQSNKIKNIYEKVSMVESLDNFKNAQMLNRYCGELGRVMDCLVEVNIGKEQGKSGVFAEDLQPFLESICDFQHIKIQGLMTIPPLFNENIEKEHYFAKMFKLFVDIQQKKIDNINMTLLSMGMSNDYMQAIKHGSHIIRLGSALFGKRISPI